MPFVTKFSKNKILKTISGDFQKEVYYYYDREIYFLNKLDISNLYNFDIFCFKIITGSSITFYQKVENEISDNFVFEGGNPSYHLYEDCPNLNSNFTNIRIPNSIKELGSESILEYKSWIKANYELLEKDFIAFKMRYELKFKNIEFLPVNYQNSGFEYVENYTRDILNRRIDSLILNAARYFNADKKRIKLLQRYQKALFLIHKDEPLEQSFGYSDEEAKQILYEYSQRFVEPTKYYLEELIKIKYSGQITNFEFGVSLLDSLNFKACKHCHAKDYVNKSDSFYLKFKETFGDFPVTKKGGIFQYKEIPNTPYKVTFILTRVLKILDENFKIDRKGNMYFNVEIDYIDSHNNYQNAFAFYYTDDINSIYLFKKYLTRVTFNIYTSQLSFQLYNFIS